jgi:hypothetical protein
MAAGTQCRGLVHLQGEANKRIFRDCITILDHPLNFSQEYISTF